jgi:hypothetical protein
MTGIKELTLISTTAKELLALALRDDTSIGKQCIQVLQLPSLAVQHGISVADYCSLAQATGSEKGATFFIEGLALPENHSSQKTFFLRSISETIPTHRFHELLLRKKYDDALQFARDYGLDEQLVLTSRLAELLRQSVNMDEMATVIKDLESITVCLPILRYKEYNAFNDITYLISRTTRL